MDYLNFFPFTEEDFDDIITSAGGRRYTNDPKIREPNCDYVLDKAVIELKMIEEEPIGKKEKQDKFVRLFAPPRAETVILQPTQENQYEYYKLLSSPIENQLKKASKQLKKSSEKTNAKLKIAIIMNNGLYMTNNDEFKKIAIERAKNNTSGIDILIVCGIYYFSDTFDMNVIFYFEDIQIRQTEIKYSKVIFEKLLKAWNEKVDHYMTEQIVNQNMKNRRKEPIKDLFFERNGIRYIKPHPQWGKKSDFWKQGRPRRDTTKESDLPISYIVPVFDEDVYQYLKRNMVNNSILQNSLDDYNERIKEGRFGAKNKITIMVKIKLDFNDLKKLPKNFNIIDVQNIINEKYELIYKQIKDQITENQNSFDCNNFILVEVQEIGIDKANDIAFISHIINNKRQEYLIDGIRMKYEYAIASAISLCIIMKAKKVYVIRNEDFKWR